MWIGGRYGETGCSSVWSPFGLLRALPYTLDAANRLDCCFNFGSKVVCLVVDLNYRMMPRTIKPQEAWNRVYAVNSPEFREFRIGFGLRAIDVIRGVSKIVEDDSECWYGLSAPFARASPYNKEEGLAFINELYCVFALYFLETVEGVLVAN